MTAAISGSKNKVSNHFVTNKPSFCLQWYKLLLVWSQRACFPLSFITVTQQQPALIFSMFVLRHSADLSKQSPRTSQCRCSAAVVMKKSLSSRRKQDDCRAHLISAALNLHSQRRKNLDVTQNMLPLRQSSGPLMTRVFSPSHKDFSSWNSWTRVSAVSCWSLLLLQTFPSSGHMFLLQKFSHDIDWFNSMHAMCLPSHDKMQHTSVPV